MHRRRHRSQAAELRAASDPRLLSVTTDRVTANRRSAEAVYVPGWGANVNGDTSVRHAGLTYKWPIDAEKKTYQFFLPDLDKAFPATSSAPTRCSGLDVYKYVSRPATSPTRSRASPRAPTTTPARCGSSRRPARSSTASSTRCRRSTDGTVALDTTLSFDESAIDFQTNYAKDKIDTAASWPRSGRRSSPAWSASGTGRRVLPAPPPR